MGKQLQQAKVTDSGGEEHGLLEWYCVRHAHTKHGNVYEFPTLSGYTSMDEDTRGLIEAGRQHHAGRDADLNWQYYQRPIQLK